MRTALRENEASGMQRSFTALQYCLNCSSKPLTLDQFILFKGNVLLLLRGKDPLIEKEKKKNLLWDPAASDLLFVSLSQEMLLDIITEN